MDAKLNHSDLSALLAKQAEISGAKAEAFTKAFFDIILEGLDSDGVVKINGLGTFKVAEVASRSSVNVNTGEKIEIKGHKKMTFLPADTLKEKVNQPFAMFEPVEIDENYVDDNEEAAETEEVDVVAASAEETIAEETPMVEAPAVEETATETVAEEAPAVETPAVEETATEAVAEEAPAAETPAVEETATEAVAEEAPAVESPAVEETATETIAEEAPIAETPAVEETAVEAVTEEAPTVENTIVEEKKKSGRVVFTLFVVIFSLFIIAAIMVGAYLFFTLQSGEDNKLSLNNTPTANKTEAPANTVAVQPIEQVADTTTTVAEGVEEEEAYTFTMVEELAAKSVGSVGRGDTLLYVADGSIATHVVAADETLTRIALKYFGDKKLWPYIVQHNKLHDPNGLSKGMELLIPRLKPAK